MMIRKTTARYISIQLMYLYISVLVIAGRNAGGVIYTTMKNVQECVAGTADVCIYGRDQSLIWRFPLYRSTGRYIFYKCAYTN